MKYKAVFCYFLFYKIILLNNENILFYLSMLGFNHQLPPLNGDDNGLVGVKNEFFQPLAAELELKAYSDNHPGNKRK